MCGKRKIRSEDDGKRHKMSAMLRILVYKMPTYINMRQKKSKLGVRDEKLLNLIKIPERKGRWKQQNSEFEMEPGVKGHKLCRGFCSQKKTV